VLPGGPVQRLLFANGDVRQPLPETIKVVDEILTDFIQGVAFEAARAAQHSGRQKIKMDDFEFTFRKNEIFLGKLQETFEKKRAIDKARELFGKNGDNDEIIKEAAQKEKELEKAKAAADRGAGAGAGGGGGGSGSAPIEDELGVGDDDVDAEADTIGR